VKASSVLSPGQSTCGTAAPGCVFLFGSYFRRLLGQVRGFHVRGGHASFLSPQISRLRHSVSRSEENSSSDRWRSAVLSFIVSIVWNGKATRTGDCFLPSTYLPSQTSSVIPQGLVGSCLERMSKPTIGPRAIPIFKEQGWGSRNKTQDTAGGASTPKRAKAAHVWGPRGCATRA
jgi:hypothetical protein